MKPGGFAAALPARAPAQLSTAVRRAIERIDWRVIAVILAIASALSLWAAFDLALASGPRRPSHASLLSATIANFIIVPSIAFATLVADEFAERADRSTLRYVVAVVIGAAIGAAAVSNLLDWFALPPRVGGLPAAEASILVRAASLFLEYLIWGSLIVFLHVNRIRAARAQARLDAAWLDRTRGQRQMIESGLQALQARVEPKFLIDTLQRVHDLYETDPGRAGGVLDRLIAYLRAALPNLRAPMSTVQREIELVTAYLGVTTAGVSQARPEPRIDVPAELRQSRFPAMILLPVIASLPFDPTTADARRPAVSIEVVRNEDRLCIAIQLLGVSGDVDLSHPNPSVVDERLRALYGDGCRLTITSPRHACVQILAEVPDEPTTRSHR